MAAASAGNGGKFGVLAVADRRQRVVERGQRLEAHRGQGIAFVGKIVGGAREPVDRDDRGPQPRGDEPGCDGKVFVMADGHVILANEPDKEKLVRRTTGLAAVSGAKARELCYSNPFGERGSSTVFESPNESPNRTRTWSRTGPELRM